MRDVLLIVALCAAAPAGAQSDHRTLDSGMSRDQVVERFGLPVVEHTEGAFSFLFYEADCGPGCSKEDVVVLKDDAVIDALLLPPFRVYTGERAAPTDTLAAPPADTAAADFAPDSVLVDSAGEPEIVPWSTFSATPLLPNGQPGFAHGRAEAVSTPPGIPAGTTTVAGFSVPAPGTPLPDGWWVAPYSGARPAPEDAARTEWLRRDGIVQQLLDEVHPDSTASP